jgi:hypothetical protein
MANTVSNVPTVRAAGAGFFAGAVGAGVEGLVAAGFATVVAGPADGGRGGAGGWLGGRGGGGAVTDADDGGGAAETGMPEAAGGAGKLIFTVGAEVGLGGKAMRTVSFFG